MKTTVFTQHHIDAGAKMAEFAGYNMPIEFTGINDEHMCVRERAGVFDVSHMGEIWVKGPKALALLQHITTNDVSKLTDGKVQYTCMPNGKGGIVDDFLVYRVDAETYLLCVNAANIDKDWKNICEHGKAMGMEPGHGKELYNASGEICQLAVQGPLAMKIVQKMCDEPVEDMEYYTFKKLRVAGVDAILSITGYTGSGGCEIYMANEDGEKVWKALWAAGKELGLQNIGLGARDTLRLEKGFCLYGNDIDDTTSPIEAGLGWITKFAEGKDFIDRAYMTQLKADGAKRKLVGFKMIDRGIPRHGYTLAAPTGEEIGHVTSGTMSPCMKIGFGMGYVKAEYAKAGTEIAVVIRDRKLKAEVVKIPFV
ncbi:MAG: glycine cleavage system aminomethyltransferase GcvT [Alistipes sp.]